MAWRGPIKARINAMPLNVLVETNHGTLDAMVCTVTSEHGEVELLEPHVVKSPKRVMRNARILSSRPKGNPVICPTSDVVMHIRPRGRVYRDRWPLPPKELT